MNRTLNCLLSSIFILSIFSLNSCTHRVNILGQHSSAYHKELRQHTRRKEAHSIEKVRFETQAVYLSEDLRRKYVEEFSKKFRLSQTETQTMLNKELQEHADHYTFLIFHFASNRKSSKIEKGAKNWKIGLSYNGESLSPDSINDIQGDALTLQYFYPQMTPWSRNYKILFAKKENLDLLNLNMDGVEGNLSFEWKI